MRLREDSKRILLANIPKLAVELDKTASAVEKNIRYSTSVLKKKPVLRAIKKITGLTEKEIFETETE